MTSKARAKVFWTGRSQAVRLPKEFRFSGDSVVIRREGTRVILEPDHEWPEGWFDWLRSKPLGDDRFVAPPRGKRTSRRVKLSP